MLLETPHPDVLCQVALGPHRPVRGRRKRPPSPSAARSPGWPTKASCRHSGRFPVTSPYWKARWWSPIPPISCSNWRPSAVADLNRWPNCRNTRSSASAIPAARPTNRRSSFSATPRSAAGVVRELADCRFSPHPPPGRACRVSAEHARALVRHTVEPGSIHTDLSVFSGANASHSRRCLGPRDDVPVCREWHVPAHCRGRGFQRLRRSWIS